MYSREDMQEQKRLHEARTALRDRMFREGIGRGLAFHLATLQDRVPDFRHVAGWRGHMNDGGKGLLRWMTEALHESGWSIEAMLNGLRYNAAKHWGHSAPADMQAIEPSIHRFHAAASEAGCWGDDEAWSDFCEAVVGWELEALGVG